MGILDSIVEWIATQIMNLLDLVTGSVLGALGCDMSTFLRYFPAAETLYEVFVAIAVGFILLRIHSCADSHGNRGGHIPFGSRAEFYSDKRFV